MDLPKPEAGPPQFLPPSTFSSRWIFPPTVLDRFLPVQSLFSAASHPARSRKFIPRHLRILKTFSSPVEGPCGHVFSPTTPPSPRFLFCVPFFADALPKRIQGPFAPLLRGVSRGMFSMLAPDYFLLS